MACFSAPSIGFTVGVQEIATMSGVSADLVCVHVFMRARKHKWSHVHALHTHAHRCMHVPACAGFADHNHDLHDRSPQEGCATSDNAAGAGAAHVCACMHGCMCACMQAGEFVEKVKQGETQELGSLTVTNIRPIDEAEKAQVYGIMVMLTIIKQSQRWWLLQRQQRHQHYYIVTLSSSLLPLLPLSSPLPTAAAVICKMTVAIATSDRAIDKDRGHKKFEQHGIES